MTYRSIHIARGGIFPNLPPTSDKKGKPTGDKTAILQYLRFDLTGKSELFLKGGKRYAFMLGFVEPGPERSFAVGNWNHAKRDDPPSLTDKYDTYHNGWALRREGDGTIPPTMTGKNRQPGDENENVADNVEHAKIVKELAEKMRAGWKADAGR